MRNSFFISGEHLLRESRMLHYQAPAENPAALSPEVMIQKDQEYLDKDFKEILKGVEKAQGITFESGRKEGIDRQIALIKMKLNKAKELSDSAAFNARRNELVGQVHQLLSYAEYQAQQQKDFEKFKGEPLAVDEYRPGEFWIEDPGSDNDPKRPTLFMSFAQRDPTVSRLSSDSWITLRPNDISASMEGRFRLVRMKDNGKNYFVLQANPNFEGTFTFYLNGKKTTVDSASAATRKDAEGLAKEKSESFEMNLPAELTEYGMLNLRARIVEEQRIAELAKLDVRDPKNAAALIAGAKRRQAAVNKINDALIKANEARAKLSVSGYNRKDKEKVPSNPLEATIYKSVLNLDDGYPTWIDGARVREEAMKQGLPFDEKLIPNNQDFMIDTKGMLRLRIREKGGDDDEFSPGKSVLEKVFKSGLWVDVKNA